MVVFSPPPRRIVLEQYEHSWYDEFLDEDVNNDGNVFGDDRALHMDATLGRSKLIQKYSPLSRLSSPCSPGPPRCLPLLLPSTSPSPWFVKSVREETPGSSWLLTSVSIRRKLERVIGFHFNTVHWIISPRRSPSTFQPTLFFPVDLQKESWKLRSFVVTRSFSV